MAFTLGYEEMLDRALASLPKQEKAAERFELPVIQGVVQGNKTLVRGFVKLASQFRRPIEHVLKFMLRELATIGEIEESNAVFVGRFRDAFLNEKVKKYAKEFVLCEQCGKPDTQLKKERGHTFKQCEACGARAVVRMLK